MTVMGSSYRALYLVGRNWAQVNRRDWSDVDCMAFADHFARMYVGASQWGHPSSHEWQPITTTTN